MIAVFRKGVRPIACLLFVDALFPVITYGAPPPLKLPLECRPNQNCWIANYVDVKPGPEVGDYQCGDLTYDGHNGVDFAIEDERVMQEGVAVLASAAGRIRATRDGVPDRNVREQGVEAVRRFECGNGVAITHGDGWETQYCHLRKGSISVKQGEVVEAGHVLGMVGMSGLTEFPHIHFTVRHDGLVIDPFLGEGHQACGKDATPLWDKDPATAFPYSHGTVFHIGVVGQKPSPKEVRSGKFDQGSQPVLDQNASAVVVFAEIFGVAAGDVVTLSITDSIGAVRVNSDFPMTKRQARWFGFAGRPKVGGAFKPGSYKAEVTLRHADGSIGPNSRRALTFEIR